MRKAAIAAQLEASRKIAEHSRMHLRALKAGLKRTYKSIGLSQQALSLQNLEAENPSAPAIGDTEVRIIDPRYLVQRGVSGCFTLSD